MHVHSACLNNFGIRKSCDAWQLVTSVFILCEHHDHKNVFLYLMFEGSCHILCTHKKGAVLPV